MTLTRLSSDEILGRLKLLPSHGDYLAMYSSWFGGICCDPLMMMVPIDDHIVHRGDGVFEAFKALDKKVYLLDAHLDRLEKSASQIKLTLPNTKDEIKDIVIQTLQASGARDALVRLFVSRGPGGFTTNPYESVGSQLYIVITRLKSPDEEYYKQGVRVGLSQVPPKDKTWATIKSCNYLPNVMMKMEAVQRMLHFTIGVDEEGHLGEGSTENIAIVDEDNFLCYPSFDRTLRGTTLIRALTLANQLVASGVIKGIRQSHIHYNDVQKWKEFMLIGTTLDALPVTEFEGQAIGNGQPGVCTIALRNLLKEDMKSSAEVTTPF